MEENILYDLVIVSNVLMESKFSFSEANPAFDQAIERIQKYINGDEDEAVFFATLFYMYNDSCRSPICFNDISHTFDCNPIILLPYAYNLKSLKDKKLLNEVTRQDERTNVTTYYYYIPEYVLNAVAANKPIQIPETRNQKEIHTFSEEVYKLIQFRIENNISTDDMIQEYAVLEDSYNLKEIEKMKKVLPNIYDRIQLVAIFEEAKFEDDHEVSLARINGRIFDVNYKAARAQTFMNDSNPLIKKGLIDFASKSSFMEAQIFLTDKGWKLILDEESAGLYIHREDKKDVLKPEDIKQQKLFYSSDIEGQIKQLYDSLNHKNFKNIQSRMKDKGWKTGLSILLYGAPGCGKTETVLQLAKETGREVFKLDIAEIRSSWVGETTKNARELFARYRRLCMQAKEDKRPTPILLLDECDAILTKRGFAETAASKEENAMQNIFRQQIEAQEGIVIATTNMAENLDPAFERRFLWKIEFKRPNEKLKTAMWKDKISWLSDEAAKNLSRWDLSGGQISNVCRKSDIEEILTGKRPDYNRLANFCKNERLNLNNSGHIGFEND